MRVDSVEFGFARAAGRVRHGRLSRGNHASHLEAASRNPAIVDEAMAAFETSSNAECIEADNSDDGWQPIRNSLVADLSAQLAALDRQREQLASLLQNIHSAETAE